MTIAARRKFIFMATLAAAGATLGQAARAVGIDAAGAAAFAGARIRRAPTVPRYRFFDADDAAFIEAAVERLIPTDRFGPGARQVGVALFIDRQLAGSWGVGQRLERNGPWQGRSHAQQPGVPRSPAVLFRTALRAIETDLGRHAPEPSLQFAALQGRVQRRAPALRRQFASLPIARQSEYLSSLRTGARPLDGVPSQVFFAVLFGLTLEGFYSDPVYGGDEDLQADARPGAAPERATSARG